MYVTNLFFIVEEIQKLIELGWEFKVSEIDVIKKAVNESTGERVFFNQEEDVVKWIMSRYDINE